MPDTPRIKMARIVMRLLENPNGIRFEELRDTYDLDERSCRSYISDLKNIPEFCDGNGNSRIEVDGWQETRRVFLRTLDIAPEDEVGHIISLYFSISMLRFLKGTELETRMQGLFDTLYKGNSRSLFYNLDKSIYSINEWPKDYSTKSTILRDCIHSLIHRKVLRINYKAVGKHEFKSHDLKIYTLLQYRNGLYLIGKTDKGDGIMVFALERITKTEKLRDTFNYPAKYSPEQYIDGAFGLIGSSDQQYNVVINFDEALKEVLTSRKWHKTSSIKELKDGTLQLSMTVSSLKQVIPWVLGFGASAKVIKPKELKDQIILIVERMTARYASSKKTPSE